MPTIVTIAGSPSPTSSSEALLSHVSRRIVRAGYQVSPIVPRNLPPAALLAGDTGDPDIAAAIRTVAAADAVVVVSPIYQVAYSGLLKVFLDVLPQFALRGKSVLPLVTGGSPAHVLVVDYALRPVLSSLGAAHIGPGWFVLGSHIRRFADGGVLIDPASAVPVAEVTDEFLATVAGRPVPAGRPVAGSPRTVSAVAGTPALTVRQVDVADPAVRPLLDELVVEYGTRYGNLAADSELAEVPASDFLPPDGAFLVLTENGDSVAGGAIRRYDEHTAEVKRVWTSSRHRRRGLAHRVMAELEQTARTLGYSRLHLTTGPRQPEARALYLSAGYQPRFDVTADPETIGPLAFGKELVAGAGFVDWVQPTWAQAQARHAVAAGGGQVTTLVFVGGGPRTVSLLERIAANAADLLGEVELDIHIVDPFPVGGGRIWRRAQSPLLWMNSVAADVTIFPDESVSCDGPIVPGPPLSEWVAGPGRRVLVDAGLQQQADAFDAGDFASREIMSLYLTWAHDRVVASLPVSVTVTAHRRRAVAVSDILCRAGDSVRQRVELDDGTVLTADVVVLAQGYLDRIADASQAALAAAAEAAGLTYLPPGYTADIDLSGLRAGDRVLVRGFGLAFIDLMVLVFEGRGGRFTTGADGELHYRARGAEPVLYVGSRRGLPYHAKLGYALERSAPVPPVYFTTAAVAALTSPGRTADFRGELWPLIVKELTHAHYRRLFAAHADRVVVSWEQFSAELDRLDADGEQFRAVVRRAVPDPADRFDLAVIDRPLRGRSFADSGELAATVAAYIEADLARRADPLHSADHAVFNALLTVYGVLAGAVVAGQVSAADRVRYLEGEFHGLFSFLASGPPPRRLAELLALHRAGLVHFAGPDLQVTIEDGRFVGSSPALPGSIVADALVDARLPRADVRSVADPVLTGLLADGELAAEDLVGPDGGSLGAGQLLADANCHAIRADRTAHPRRFLLGPSVSGSAGSAGFARPGFNAPGFRQNDRVARDLLRLAASSVPPSSATALLSMPGQGPGTPDSGPTHHLTHALHRMEISHAR